jgi:hypothetical protein
MKKNNVLKEIAQGLGRDSSRFCALEALLSIAYFGRDWMVTEISVTYMFGDDHGPIPPWLDGLRILQPDKLDLEESTKHPAEVHRFFHPGS